MNYEIVTLVDDNGTELIRSSELHYSPQDLQPLDEASPAVKRTVNLASDFFKGAITLPNKTVEIVFKPNIQKGLDEGIYKLMTTGQGGTLADAINISNQKIVGKGRIVEAGKINQLMVGAFQLVSIAVAQAHLSDINRSLNQIQCSIDKVLEKMEESARSEIQGAIAYLHDLVEFMSHLEAPDHLPSTKRMKIEDINYEFRKWRETVMSEMRSLITRTKNQKDLDTFGTANTYYALKQHVEEARVLNDRYELLLMLASMFNIVAAYLDPQRKQFSRVDPQVEEWMRLMEEMERSTHTKVGELLRSAAFNQQETLTLRQRDVISMIDKQLAAASNQKNTYQDRTARFSHRMRQLINDRGEMRMALTFDSSGIAASAAIVPS